MWLTLAGEVDIDSWKVIGSGGQGEVRKGIYRGRAVAAKALLHSYDEANLAAFLTETKILRLPRCVIFLTCSACCTMRTSLSLLGS
jgi:hypothetical protein